jgi:predicted GNAT family acetyltransferase
MDILHTEVPGAWSGKGIGKRLVDAAIKFAEQENYSIKASCSFVQKILNLISGLENKLP